MHLSSFSLLDSPSNNSHLTLFHPYIRTFCHRAINVSRFPFPFYTPDIPVLFATLPKCVLCIHIRHVSSFRHYRLVSFFYIIHMTFSLCIYNDPWFRNIHNLSILSHFLESSMKHGESIGNVLRRLPWRLSVSVYAYLM